MKAPILDIPAQVQGVATVTQIGKDQNVRRWDVFFLGPLLVREGMRKRNREPLLGWAMIAAGVGTIVYNRRNFITQALATSRSDLADLPEDRYLPP